MKTYHWLWAVDCSGSMNIDNVIEKLKTELASHAQALNLKSFTWSGIETRMSLITFSDSAKWLWKEIPLPQVSFKNIKAEGPTKLGAALNLISEHMMSQSNNQDIFTNIVIISDGMPTDDCYSAISQLKLSLQKNSHFSLFALGLGEDVDLEPLEKIAEKKVFLAKSIQNLPTSLQALHKEAIEEALKWFKTQAQSGDATISADLSAQSIPGDTFSRASVIKEILANYHDKRNEFSALHPVTKIGLKNREEFKRNAAKPIFCTVQQGGPPIFAVALENNETLAFPNPTMTYLLQIFQENAYGFWFDFEAGKMPDRFKIQVIEPAEIIQTTNQEWECRKKGKLKFLV